MAFDSLTLGNFVEASLRSKAKCVNAITKKYFTQETTEFHHCCLIKLVSLMMLYHVEAFIITLAEYVLMVDAYIMDVLTNKCILFLFVNRFFTHSVAWKTSRQPRNTMLLLQTCQVARIAEHSLVYAW